VSFTVLPLIGIEPILTKNGTHQRGQEMRRVTSPSHTNTFEFKLTMKVRIALFWCYHRKTTKRRVWYAQEVLHLILTHLLSLITGT